MAGAFARGERALGVCDVCGFTYKLKTLRQTTVKGAPTGIRACPTCWDADHPQNFLGAQPVYDAEALRDARPDSGQLASVRAQLIPINPVVSTGFIGSVTIDTP